MYIQQLYTGCLSQAAYYIESDGEAAVIDPIRDTQGYIEIANERKAKIKYIFETHFHADFVSGHVELLKKTGAKIVYGPEAKASYDIVVGKDGQEFTLGKSTIKVIHTPGHTIESSCFLAIDENDKPVGVFTGDTLFVGEVGRVDLAAKSELSDRQMASLMYDSLEKLKKLPEDVIVYPGHGAGSACGKNIGSETTSTIALQKRNNYALQPMDREAFIDIVVTGIAAPPRYFFTDVHLNHVGYEDEESLSKNVHPIELSQFKKDMEAGIVVIDTRSPADFAKEHIAGSISIGLDGQYAIWAGNLFDNVPFLIVCDEGKEQESITRLARVGYDKVKGYLKGGVNTWKQAGLKMQSIESIEANTFIGRMAKEGSVLDVRNEGEVQQGLIKDAITIPLAELEAKLGMLNADTHYYIYCRSGYRSMIAASILQKNGFKNLTNVIGGMTAISKTGVKLEVPAVA
ncbi:MAG TPA: MBL fold metallo-hydrolase [Bacteroidia bacterium]|nr:MBL fold metallo-hydrolase [Bacteroidia bacterium]